MAEDNRKDFSRLDDESITEIDLGSFLSDDGSKAPQYDDLHTNIAKTEKSLEDELQNLYDNIMSSGPAPKIKVEVEKTVEAKPQSELESMWLSPEEYIEMPKVPAENENPEMVAASSPVVDNAKDDIFSMIENLKTETDKEQGFDEILTGIENNKGIELVDTDLAKTDSLTVDAKIPETPAPEMLMPELPTPPQNISTPEMVAPIPSVKIDGVDTDSPEFDKELSELLGDEPKVEDVKEEPIYVDTPPAQPLYVNTPPSKPMYVDTPPATPVAPAQPPVFVDSLTHNERTVGVVTEEIQEDNGKITRKEKKQKKLEEKQAEGKAPKKGGAGDVVRKIVLAIAILTIIGSSGWLGYTYLYEPNKYKADEGTIQESVDIEQQGVVETADGNYPEGMLLKYTQLYDINNDLKGWISIPGLEINLPVVQGTDNDYYLHKNIYKKKTQYGVPFFDYRIKDFKDLPKNMVIYGHNMRYDDLIFGLLENYRDIETFQKNPVIECNTIYGDHKWFVYAVFITGSNSNHDNGYLFPYNFVDLSEEDFQGYINEIDKRKLYTTGVDINATDKILTLSTCCYDFQDARLVVVARLMRDGESPIVDTTKAVKNDNPKYPQAWYNAFKKANPYEADNRWDPSKK